MNKIIAGAGLVVILGLSLSLPSVQAAQSTETALTQAKTFLDAGKPLPAKRSLERLKKTMEKKGDDKAKLVDVLVLLGQANEASQSYADANAVYTQAVATQKELNADSQATEAMLTKLHEKYMPVDFAAADKDKKFSDVTKCAGAIKGDNGQHVSIELLKMVKGDPKDMLGDGQKLPEPQIADTGSGGKAPALKGVRFDKKIGFDVTPEGQNKVRVKNIEGILLNVGLWVKLQEVLLPLDDSDPNPGIDVTAGKLGVVKTVHVGLPQDSIKSIRKGIEFVDPFFNTAIGTVTGPVNTDAAAAAAASTAAPPQP